MKRGGWSETDFSPAGPARPASLATAARKNSQTRDSVLVAAQRREPHLPVEPRLERGDESRTAAQFAGFVFEFISQPVRAVVAAFHDDFVAVAWSSRQTIRSCSRCETAPIAPPPSRMAPATGDRTAERDGQHESRNRPARPRPPRQAREMASSARAVPPTPGSPVPEVATRKSPEPAGCPPESACSESVLYG